MLCFVNKVHAMFCTRCLIVKTSFKSDVFFPICLSTMRMFNNITISTGFFHISFCFKCDFSIQEPKCKRKDGTCLVYISKNWTCVSRLKLYNRHSICCLLIEIALLCIISNINYEVKFCSNRDHAPVLYHLQSHMTS